MMKLKKKDKRDRKTPNRWSTRHYVKKYTEQHEGH